MRGIFPVPSSSVNDTVFSLFTTFTALPKTLTWKDSLGISQRVGLREVARMQRCRGVRGARVAYVGDLDSVDDDDRVPAASGCGGGDRGSVRACEVADGGGDASSEAGVARL
jgi:hypothetical protein